MSDGDDASVVADFYARWAALYDRIATAPGIGRWRRITAGRAAAAGETVIEMGCGTGANLPFLREHVGPTGRVVGIDIAGPLIDRARRRAGEYDNVSVVRADATTMPVRAADAVLATFVCGLFEDPAAVVDRWCDLVGPGGRVALLDATASEDPRGRPLNPLFNSFVAAGSPSGGLRDVLYAPVGGTEGALSRRVDASRAALAARTVDRRHETFGLGFVGLLSGTVQRESKNSGPL
ncbi:MAG: phosphatidylethanolamine/phosphatidyl-N-methylethanolamine N-methyltransferase [Natronomonas sp.]|jgi:ubiquinone/menaquinone biosynthesis C-methylase UbiE|uniref:class I SAM-dependent methyltransferase n=1 Tax=Natronomonas sp. TaxID=2184060 RepID=UPI003988B995